jgi:hypothetical protein
MDSETGNLFQIISLPLVCVGATRDRLLDFVGGGWEKVRQPSTHRVRKMRVKGGMYDVRCTGSRVEASQSHLSPRAGRPAPAPSAWNKERTHSKHAKSIGLPVPGLV